MRKTRGRRPFAGLATLVAIAAAITMLFAGGAGAIVAGAGFTTNDPNIDGNSSCLNGPASATPKVNCNLYGSKSFVWINGGPSGGQNSLTDGTYFFAVLDPGGQKDPNDGTDGNLSDVSPTTNTPGGDAYTAREFTVSGGKIAAYIGSGHNTDAFYTDPNGLFINLMPYDDTTNPGGVYILAICQLSTDQATAPIEGTVTPSQCKYDAFKAPSSTCTENCEPHEFGAISGLKYYDANANGQFDPGELPIPGWKIDYKDGTSGTLVTDGLGQFSVTLSGDTYLFGEEHPTNTTGAPFNLPLWVQTGNTVNQTSPTGIGESASLSNFIYTVTHTDTGSTSGLNFGNVCLGAGGGLTLGFWSNKNGQAAMNDGGTLAPELALLSGLNLRNANGSNFDPANYAAFRNWILSANAVNMAYMLSAQLAAMELNVEAGYVNGAALVYVGGAINAFWSVNALMTAANASLGTDGYTVASGATRTYQETLKSALDAGNNNVNFLQQPSNGQLPACASTTIAGWTAASFPTP